MSNVGMIVQDVSSPYSVGDTPIEERLRVDLSHTMFFLESDNPGNLTASDVSSFVSSNSLDLVVITSANLPVNVDGDIFDALATPVLHIEGVTWDDDLFCASGKSGETSSTYTTINVVTPSHPIADGQSGSTTVLTSARKMNRINEGHEAAGVTVIAKAGSSSYATVWAIEAGDLLSDSSAAPARRVGWFFNYDAGTVANATAWSMFDEAVAWLLDGGATLTPSATLTADSTMTGSGQATDDAVIPSLMVEAAFGIDFEDEPADGAGSYFDFPGATGDYVSTPDSTANSITGSFSVAAHATLDDWSSGATQFLFNKWLTSGSQRAWALAMLSAGTITLYTSDDGSFDANEQGVSTNPSFVPGDSRWIRADYDSIAPAITFFHSADSGETAVEDVSWTELNTDAVTNSSVIDSTGTLTVGGYNNGVSGPAGAVDRAYLYSGAFGGAAPVAAFDARDAIDDDTAFVSKQTGETWTPNGNVTLEDHNQWFDITDDVRVSEGVRISRGRSADLGVTQTGTCTFLANNRDRDYEPGFAGKWGDNINPMTHVRVRAEYYGVTHQLFRGYVEDWSPVYPEVGLDAVTRVTCVDMLAVAARTKVDGGFISTHILDAAGFHWPVDEQTGNYAREIKAPTTNSAWIANLTLNDDTFATDGISRKQYPKKETAAFGLEPVIDAGNTGEGTLSGWFKWDTTITATAWVFCDMRNTAFTRTTWLVDIEADGGITVNWTDDGTTAGVITLVATSDVNDGNWHHLAMVRRGSGTSWVLDAYLDGVALALDVTGPVETPWGGPTESESMFYNFLGNYGQVSYLNEALSDVAMAELYNAYLDIFPSQTSSERIEQVLDYLSIPATLESVGVGVSTLASTDHAGSTVAAVLDEAARAEMGLVFVNGAGKLTFHPRSLRTSSLPAIDIGEGTVIPVQDLTFRSPTDLLYNQVVVTWASGASVSAVDTTSVATYGERRLDVTINVTTEAVAQSYADHLLSVYKDPQLRVDSVVIQPTKDAANMMFTCLDAELSDRVNVNFDPLDIGGASADIDYFGFIEAIAIDIDSHDWHFTWRVSPQALSVVTF